MKATGGIVKEITSPVMMKNKVKMLQNIPGITSPAFSCT